MSAGDSKGLGSKNLRVLLYKDELSPEGKGARVLVYTLPHVSFKGATVCLGYRVFYGEEAYRRLLGLVPKDLEGVVKPVVMGFHEFLSARNGYFVGGLVFLESDEAGRLYIHDPDTDGKVYLPALVAYHPRPVYDFEMVPLGQIRVVDELRYRSEYSVDDLADSISRFGLLSPLVVYRDKKVYRLLAGYRRYYALKKLGWPHAPCLVLNMPPETQNLVPLVENFFRSQPTREEYRRLVEYIVNECGRYASVYELLRALNVRDRRTVLELLRQTGLSAEPAKIVEVGGVGSEDGSLRRLVEGLLGEGGAQPAPDGYDDEAILSRIEGLGASQSLVDGGEGSWGEGAPQGVGGGDLGEGVGLIELPLELLGRLARYLRAQDAEGFRLKLTRLLESVVDSPIIAVCRCSGGRIAWKLRRLAEESGGELVVLEPDKL